MLLDEACVGSKEGFLLFPSLHVTLSSNESLIMCKPHIIHRCAMHLLVARLCVERWQYDQQTLLWQCVWDDDRCLHARWRRQGCRWGTGDASRWQSSRSRSGHGDTRLQWWRFADGHGGGIPGKLWGRREGGHGGGYEGEEAAAPQTDECVCPSWDEAAVGRVRLAGHRNDRHQGWEVSGTIETICFIIWTALFKVTNQPANEPIKVNYSSSTTA